MSARHLIATAACALSFVGATLVTQHAGATILDFDDLSTGGTYASFANYGGLTWSNSFALNSNATVYSGTGYQNGEVSGGGVVAFDGYGSPLEITSAADFTFNGTYMTGAWNDGLQVTINGYNDGALVNSMVVTVNTTSPTWVAANFANVDRLTFSSAGGTLNPALNGKGYGTQFALDNFTFNEGKAASVPELGATGASSAVALLAAAYFLLSGRRRRAA